MDVLAHALYGATVCSRTGLAGRTEGTAVRPWMADWTVWCSALFGILPDAFSLGPPMIACAINGGGNFFLTIDETTLMTYRYMHSLLVALAAAGIVRWIWKPLFVPSLAWPLHVLMDSVTHGAGKFQTTLFYPLSSWGFDSIRWWQHPEIVLAYWLVLPAIWLGLWAWRRRKRSQ